MCIKKVESYEFAGKLYISERDAVEAAIREAGARLLKDHHASVGVGLIEMRDHLIDLLTRHHDLDDKPEATSAVPWHRGFSTAYDYRRHIVGWVKSDPKRLSHANRFVVDWETWVLNCSHNIKDFEEHFANWKD